jgi:MFS family permease
VSAQVGPVDASEETGRRLRRAVYGATFFVRFAFGVSISIFAAYIAGRTVPSDAETFGVIGLVSAMAPVGEFSTVLLSGISADRFGRFPILLGGMGSATILLLAASFSRQPLALGGINLLFGIASGAILASSLAVVGDQAARTRRGNAMGRFDALNLLGWIVGFAVGLAGLGTLPNALLPDLFRLSAGVLAAGVVFALVSRRGFREKPTVPAFALNLIRQAVFRRDVLVVVLPWLVIYMLIGTAFVFLGAASTGEGVPPLELSALIGGGGLVLLLTQPYFGTLADRFGRLRLMVIGTIGFVAVLGLAAAIAMYGPRPPLLGAIAFSALFALGYGPAALAALTDLSRTLHRGTTMAIYSLVISLGMILGLAVSTQLFAHLGTLGLDLFFAGVAISLVGLTTMRWYDLKTGRGVVALIDSADGTTTQVL